MALTFEMVTLMSTKDIFFSAAKERFFVQLVVAHVKGPEQLGIIFFGI